VFKSGKRIVTHARPVVNEAPRTASNSHFGFRGLAILASALRCRMNAAFRTRPERRIYAAGPQNENRCRTAEPESARQQISRRWQRGFLQGSRLPRGRLIIWLNCKH
jgi:hypothetical protein